MAMTQGLTCAIMDARTPSVVSSVKATDLLLGHDEWGSDWIYRHRQAQAAQKAAAEAAAEAAAVT
jgi:5-methyltetrahydrofolate--homocysteine methyltransferase